MTDRIAAIRARLHTDYYFPMGDKAKGEIAFLLARIQTLEKALRDIADLQNQGDWFDVIAIADKALQEPSHE